MNCNECEEKIWTYRERSSLEQKQVDEHLKECANCRTLMEEAMQFNRQIAEAKTPSPRPQNAAALTERIMESLPAEQKVSSTTLVVERLSQPWIQYPMRMAAMVLILFFVRESFSTTIQSKIISEEKNTIELNTIEFMKRLQHKRTAPKTITYYERYQKIKQTNI